MKWFFVFGFCVYFVKISDANAIKSPAEANNEKLQTTENTEKEYLNSEVYTTQEDVRIAECESGTEWESNCHSCRCEKGTAVCTRMDTCDKGYGEPLRCKPQTSFKKDCNMCRCLDNGLVICTYKGCPHKIPKKPDLPPGRDCAPGTSWKSRCNDCVCTEEGITNCTKNDCPGDENEREIPCKPGSAWKNECNRCWCTDDGYQACTKMGCNMHALIKRNPSTSQEEENGKNEQSTQNRKSIEVRRTKRSQVCRPGSFIEVGCNTCFCTVFGRIGSCTDNICNTGEDFRKSDKENELTKLIESDPFDTSNIIQGGICKSNSLFKVNCNECACADDGKSYSCTDDECDEKPINVDVEVFKEEGGPDHIERHSVCKPRGIFYMGCNTCKCNVDGSNYSCTNKPCPLPDDVEIFKELEVLRSSLNSSKAIVCSANRMFIKDCNTCWCNEDGTGFFCTRKVCIPDLPEETEETPENLRTIKQKCRPDEVFELDCNMCRCNSDGQSYSCTRRICVPDNEDKKTVPIRRSRDTVVESIFRRKRATSQQKPTADTTPSRLAPTLKGAPKNCQPGQEFRMDCNKCLCDNEGQNYSCTRIDCAALNNNNNGAERTKREVAKLEQECSPGSVFDQGCNVCQCTTDGNHAVCTTKRCQEQTTDNEVSEPEADPNFRCNPGEQFKRGCKDCTCSADGKSVFCTLRLCDQDITPSL